MKGGALHLGGGMKLIKDALLALHRREETMLWIRRLYGKKGESDD